MNSVLIEALKLRELGYAVVPQIGKSAYLPGWNKRALDESVIRVETSKPGVNLAVVTGLSSPVEGHRLVVIDCDIRGGAQFKREAYAAIQMILGDLNPTTRTGGGGAHWYLAVPETRLPLENRIVLAEGPQLEVDGKPRAAWTIELLANGHACTVPPSVHPSGKPYAWVNGGAHVQIAPDALYVAIEQARTRISRPAVSPTAPRLPATISYRCIADVEARPVRWLWTGRIARGKVSLIAGHPGLGKSQITASLAAIVSTGGFWPVDRTRADRGNVIFLSAEDDAEDTIRPRLEASGADLSRVFILDAVRDKNKDGEPISRAFNLKTDLVRLAALLEEIGDVALVVIDPISAYLGGVDSHYNADVRALLSPLGEAAARHGAAVVCVSHLNKGPGGGSDALLRVTGSIAFVAAARSAYLVAKDDEDDARRLFLPLKNNVGNDQGGLAFSLQAQTLDSGIATCRVLWEGEAVTVTADQALAVQSVDRSELDEAKEFLETTLGGGRVLSKQINLDAEANGISRATLRRAKKALGVKAVKEGTIGESGKWYWCLPCPEETSKALISPEDAQAKRVSAFDVDEHLRAKVRALFGRFADLSELPADGRDEDLQPFLADPAHWIPRLEADIARLEQPL